MDLRYEEFCFADPVFFDLQRKPENPGDEFAAELPEPPDDWRSLDRGVWRHLQPPARELPGQGWKIHVSATMGNAGRVLGAVWAYCVARAVPFKHLRTRGILLSRNAKYAARDASGKLVTIYPSDSKELERVLQDLSDVLAGEPGPYILSDLRYGDGPLYVRYGGFAEQWVEAEGRRVLAIRDPQGDLVPDKRGPTFQVPEWEPLPDCLAPHLSARKTGDPGQFAYQVDSALHFSNGGGVYAATRKSDGKELVLKEARPHAGLDRDHVDAVARLRREHRILRRLDGIPGIPQVYDLFTFWEHTFMAMERVSGIQLGSWLARNYPLTRLEPDAGAIERYTERALALVDKIERLVGAIHDRGVVFADLHQLNILVDEDDTVSLIDFELAFGVDGPGKPALGAPGFRAPADRAGFEIDEYALAALRLWIFLPLTSLLELAPGKLPGLVDFIHRRFDLPAEYTHGVLKVLTPRNAAPPAFSAELGKAEPDWTMVRKSIAAAILASATPDRTDRLFPGDPDQFTVGGACFGVGAAGVLHALAVTGEGRYPEHERWLLDYLRREPSHRPGFYDGTHGIAYVLENFGYHDEAAELLAASARLVEQTTEHSLDTGLAGIGLNLLHFAGVRADRDFREQAVVIGARLAAALPHAAPPGAFGRSGLLSGWSGPALLFVRLFEHTADSAWLDLADQALRRDLEECVQTDDGSLQVRDGDARTLPYVAIGSAGVAMVAEQLAVHLPDAESAAKLPGLRLACRGEFVAHPGLMLGRAGLLTTLAMGRHRGHDEGAERAIELHLSRLAWHAMPFGGGTAFPGNQLARLSMDFNTGGAGVLVALAITLDGAAALPFFGGAPRTPVG
ncbi:MAG TPA: class III lanthionine synthetase LanKC [Amycolatopsis sp.]|uniref:class III lanthionine synthetase LanKC n=1 Tax=Amycolatopsis sp. TaxID=37632 RepID=UPI002B489722|nr:class III lanthionine synthetase LanKC [Amycolatopsis sp.]HKS45067.1 class III lanthionine synthetase LanKC [Amycolatopsis sp.]